MNTLNNIFRVVTVSGIRSVELSFFEVRLGIKTNATTASARATML